MEDIVDHHAMALCPVDYGKLELEEAIQVRKLL